MPDKQQAATEEHRESIVYLIRGEKVVLDMHLAEAFGIGQQILVQAVERNMENFPEGSVLRLNKDEIAGLELQLVDSAAAFAFTRYGVAVLASTLFDERSLHESQEACAPTCSCRK